LDDSVFGVGAAGLFVFLFWDPEKQNRLEPQVLSSARFIGNFLDRQLKNAWQTRDRPALLHFFTYKQRQNKIVNAQMCLAGEISQGRRTPQPTRAMHEFSHSQRLRNSIISRKASQRRSCHLEARRWRGITPRKCGYTSKLVYSISLGEVLRLAQDGNLRLLPSARWLDAVSCSMSAFLV